MDVVRPEQRFGVPMVHHRMNARQDQRVHGPGHPRVPAERRQRRRTRSNLVEPQHVREDGLRADLPVDIQRVDHTEPIGVLEAELAEEPFSIALGRSGVAAALPAKIDETLRSPVITVQGGEVSER